MSTSQTAAERHVPVMRARVLELLSPALQQAGAVYLDGTLGLGGHMEAVLSACPRARGLGIDRDGQALALAGERLAAFADRLSLRQAVYDELPEVLAEDRVDEVSAALFDLGVSSLQLDEPERGFAYAQDAPLDMRMDQDAGFTAADVLNSYDAQELERVLRDYGEERYARKVAAAIVRDRAVEPFTRSGRLVALLQRVIPGASQRSGGHPARRTFQALRIEVNAELRAWERALPAAVGALRVGGRIVVLSYHSLEDRITKRVLSAGARSSAPEGLPVELPEHAPYLRLLTRGAEEPTEEEKSTNPRSASARLRAAERVRAGTGGRR
jgi:16S rRNA (cytosine1402-N4)-methyltransferase